MKIKVDNEADAVYIYIQEKNNYVESTIMLDEFYKIEWMINFDIDSNWKIIWVEIISIDLIYDINKIKFDLNNNLVKLIFSKNNDIKTFKVFNDNIIVGLDINWKITLISIKNIIDMNNIKNNLMFEM